MTTFVHWTRGAALAVCLGGALAACGDEPRTDAAKGGGEPAMEAPTSAAPASDEGHLERLQATYDKGIDFLKKQSEDGKWKMQGYPDPGSTAMALTVILERPGGVRDQDAEVVSKGIAFLTQSLGEDGGVSEAQAPNYMTSAVVGALVATGDAAHADRIAAAADYLKKLQFLDADLNYGGIGYGSDKTRSDLSNTQFALGSLRAAGIGPEDPAFQAALKFLTRTQNRKENEAGDPTATAATTADGDTVERSNDGGSNYRPFDSKAGTDTLPDGTKVTRSYGSVTYALLRCYHLCGLDASDGRVQAAVEWLQKHWTLDVNPGMPDEQKLNGLYYYYMTMAKALTVAGIDELVLPDGKKVDWRTELAARLTQVQRADGSWANTDPRWMEANPVIATAYSLMALSDCEG